MIIGEWVDRKKLFEIAVTIAIEEEIIHDDSELDYELCGQRGYFYRLVSKKRELIARINIKKINQIRYSRNGVKKDSLGKIKILQSIYIGIYYNYNCNDNYHYIRTKTYLCITFILFLPFLYLSYNIYGYFCMLWVVALFGSEAWVSN